MSSFAGSGPTTVVWPGYLSAPGLGVALDSWDMAGRSVRNEVGELVVTAPMPSMPTGLWGDDDGSRYRSAYFDTYPGVWRHGDRVTLTSDYAMIVHGRSDATLNRNGVRMGSSDIYQAVETVADVTESLVVGVERPDGGYWRRCSCRWRRARSLTIACDRRSAPPSVKVHHRVICQTTSSKSTLCHTR